MIPLYARQYELDRAAFAYWDAMTGDDPAATWSARSRFLAALEAVR